MKTPNAALTDMTDADLILAALATATPQTPLDEIALRKATRLTRARIAAGLAALLDTGLKGRLINTATVIKDGTTRSVYWPTGIIRRSSGYHVQAATGRVPPTKQVVGRPSKPPAVPALPLTNTEEPVKPVKQAPSKTDRAIALIRDRGHIPDIELAAKAEVEKKNLYGLLTRKADQVVHLIIDGVGHWATKAYAEAREAETRTESDTQTVAASAEDAIPRFLLKQLVKDRGAAEPPAFCDFSGLHINAEGCLHITLTDNSIVALPPAETARLGRFLVDTQGVWSTAQ